MGTFYTANNNLKEYLLQNGCTFHDREDSKISYYTHLSKNQVKVDTEKNLVTLLDETGREIDSSSSFTDNQIKNFLNK